MTASEDDARVWTWKPPPGMAQQQVTEWRNFYRRALKNYGITPREYRLLYLAQRGRCWICRKAKGKHPDDPKAGGARRLGVDHDHVTGAVRGLLCTGGDKTCNRIIGWLGPDALERAAAYLRGDVPVVALTMVEREMDKARSLRITLTDAEQEALAMAALWPENMNQREGEARP